MTPDLKDFLAYYLPETDLAPLLNCFERFEIKKNKHLLEPGQNCNYLGFIQNGCFRVYHYDKKGKEIITWFSFEKMIITDLLGYYTTGRAHYYVEALEDSVVYKITKPALENVYKQNAIYQEFGRKFAEEAITILMERTLSLHTQSADERYRALMKEPSFMEKIPLKYLASYLGVTDTSLSRIRKTVR